VNNIEVGYMTSTEHLMSMTIYGESLDRDNVPTFPNGWRLDLCGECNGANGGCPVGGAPHYHQLKSSIQGFYVLVVRFDMVWAIKYGGVGKGVRQSNYFRSGYADRLTDWYTWRLLRRLEENASAYSLGCGNCPKCSPKKCTVMTGAKCLYPDQRRYSVEAVGVDCSSLHNMLFGHRLAYWYYEEELPQYMYRYSGLFVEDDVWDYVVEAVLADASYNDNLPEPHGLQSVECEAPEGVYDEGMAYQGYLPKS